MRFEYLSTGAMYSCITWFSTGYSRAGPIGSSTYDVLFCICGRSGDTLYSLLLVLPAVVPVVNKARPLDGLRCCVRRVTCEKQVISGLDAPCWG